MEITLVRHGESLNNVGLSQSLDSVLTNRGANQAELTALRLGGEAKTAPFSLALVSPLRRTQMTFRPIYRATHVAAAVAPEVCEYFDKADIRYQTFAGLTKTDISRDFPYIDVSALPDSNRWWPDPLEDTHAIRARAARVAADLRIRYGDTKQRILIVSHAEPIARLVEALLGWEPSNEPPTTGNCGIWRIASTADPASGTALLSNSREHLAILDLTRGNRG